MFMLNNFKMALVMGAIFSCVDKYYKKIFDYTMAEELKYGFGCTPSVMDGTEYEVNVDEKIELPKKLDWSGMMLPIFD